MSQPNGAAELRSIIVDRAETPKLEMPDRTLLDTQSILPPVLPDLLRPDCMTWTHAAADGAGCPVDYIVLATLAATGALIGNQRWGQPWLGWIEPSVLFVGVVGLPSSGKSPGLGVVERLLACLEQELNEDWSDRWRLHVRDITAAKERHTNWENDVRTAVKQGKAPPDLPFDAVDPEAPQKRRLVSTDPTIEKAARLSHANPRGLLLFRDELAGWIGSMDRYSGGKGGDRAFWLQAYGGQRWTPDRVKDGDQEIVVPHLLWGVCGGIQPDRVASQLLTGDDDGLAARLLFTWPASREPRRPTLIPDHDRALRAFRRLRDLPWQPPEPTIVPFTDAAANLLQVWREEVWGLEKSASGLFLSWLGKLPGFCVRLSVILQHLDWAWSGEAAPPSHIEPQAVARAADLLEQYALPMARRVFRDAAMPEQERDARTIARWLVQQRPVPDAINSRELRRMANGPGVNEPDRLTAALRELEAAGWVSPNPNRDSGHGRQRSDWAVHKEVKGMTR
jgi:hypothetical protein